jgi:hypothetical protein
MKNVIFAIVAIVVISALSVVYVNSITGQASYDMNAANSYGGSKVYGGAIRKAMADDPSVFGKAYGKEMWALKWQETIYSNRDKLVCGFGDEAIDSKYPCIFDESLQNYCCLTSA